MEISATETTVEAITPWRDFYRQEMPCQIIHDSLHVREGWTRPYLLTTDGIVAGYGSIAVGGPWRETPALFEFYVLPRARDRAFALFEALLAATGVAKIEVQSNDPLVTVMLHAFAKDVVTESILFHDRLTTAHPAPVVVFRQAAQGDEERVPLHLKGAKWVLERKGEILATGGILYHYNRPYGDIYMEVLEPFRRQGLGSYLVQELKKVCYDGGSIPSARCNPSNTASRQTLQKAGFVPCGHILTGMVARPGSTLASAD